MTYEEVRSLLENHPIRKKHQNMKRYCYEIKVWKTFEVYADNDDEAIERALQEEIKSDDLEITFKERTQPNTGQ